MLLKIIVVDNIDACCQFPAAGNEDGIYHDHQLDEQDKTKNGKIKYPASFRSGNCFFQQNCGR